jgi:hypothetical protein
MLGCASFPRVPSRLTSSRIGDRDVFQKGAVYTVENSEVQRKADIEREKLKVSSPDNIFAVAI